MWILCVLEAECVEVGRGWTGSGQGRGLVRDGGKEIVSEGVE